MKKVLFFIVVGIFWAVDKNVTIYLTYTYFLHKILEQSYMIYIKNKFVILFLVLLLTVSFLIINRVFPGNIILNLIILFNFAVLSIYELLWFSQMRNNIILNVFKFPYSNRYINLMLKLENVTIIVSYFIYPEEIRICLFFVNLIFHILLLFYFNYFMVRKYSIKKHFENCERIFLYNHYLLIANPLLMSGFSKVQMYNSGLKNAYYYDEFNCFLIIDTFCYRNLVNSMAKEKFLILLINSKKIARLSYIRQQRILKFLEFTVENNITPIICDVYYWNKNKLINGASKYFALNYAYYRCDGFDFKLSYIVEDMKYNKDNYYFCVKEEIRDIVNIFDQSKINDNMKYLVILLYENQDSLSLFYNMIKICEYIIFICCMRNINDYDSIVNLEKPSLGDYLSYIEDDFEYNDVQLIESIKFLDSASTRGNISTFKGNKVSYLDLCELICRIRNRFIGHGSMIHTVTYEFVFHVLKVGKEILKRYCDTFRDLDNKVIHLKVAKPPVMIEYHGKMYYYNALLDNENSRYINFESGQIITYNIVKNAVKRQITLNCLYNLEDDNNER